MVIKSYATDVGTATQRSQENQTDNNTKDVFMDMSVEQKANLQLHLHIFGYNGSLKDFMSALGSDQIISGSGITDSALQSGVAGSPYHVDFKKGFKLLTDPNLWKTPTKEEVADAKKRVKVISIV